MSTVIASNPMIPYSGVIPGKMCPGKTLFIQGYVEPHASRFTVNLTCGLNQAPMDDIALAFSPSYQQGLVVVNHLKKQVWGQPLQVQNVIQKGQNFEMIILCEAHQFKIAVNGVHFISSPHYIKKLPRISHIMINGELRVYNIRMEGPAAPAAAMPPQPGFAYPPTGPQYPPAQPQPHYPPAQPQYPPAQPQYPSQPQPVNNPPVPYLAMIPGGMKDGKIIVVKVTVKPNPLTRFHVNLQCGMSTNPRSDVALQFNPRFREQYINLNTLRNTRWDGNEIKHRGHFPFHPNGTYEIMFLCTKQMFKVALNGSHLLEYQHRLPFQNISALGIEGDVRITQITFN
ncbi:galectin-8-like [Asterias rubens]|uniref:galectin-8-like n=1 Tax=Asterias rubens TaxID=7604 RepID=UPI0014559702|nr:galectin-8-like [Asterias rubens]XP_033647788.1 galectin-8-like [Asterias rubens]